MKNLTPQQQEIIRMITSEFDKLNGTEQQDMTDIEKFINAERQKIFDGKENKRILNNASIEFGNCAIFSIAESLSVLKKYGFKFSTSKRWQGNNGSLKIDVMLPYTIPESEGGSHIGKSGEFNWTIEQYFDSWVVPNSQESYSKFSGVKVAKDSYYSSVFSVDDKGVQDIIKNTAQHYLNYVKNFPHRFKTV